MEPTTPIHSIPSHETASHNLVEKLHKGADFLYGVLIAVSIEKGIEGFLHVSAHEWFVDPTHPHQGGESPHAPEYLMVWRLMILLVMVARFYIGSIRYFTETYKNPPNITDSSSFKNRFSFDFFAGLVHFSFFFALGLSLTVPAGNVDPFDCYKLSSFSIVLMFILLFDMLWLPVRLIVTRVSQQKDARSNSEHAEYWKRADKAANHMIWRWGRMNLFVTLAMLAVFVVIEISAPDQLSMAETAALLPLFIHSFKDFRKIVKQ